MSTADQGTADHGGAAAHAADDHGADHGDDDAHGGEALGAIDVAAWGAGALGIALGLVVALCMALATSPLPA